jgi:hypothetical protein
MKKPTGLSMGHSAVVVQTTSAIIGTDVASATMRRTPAYTIGPRGAATTELTGAGSTWAITF